MPEASEKEIILRRIRDTAEDIMKRKIEIEPDEDLKKFLSKFRDYLLLVKNYFDTTYLFVNETEENIQKSLKKKNLEENDLMGFPEIGFDIKLNEELNSNFKRHVGLSSKLLEVSRTNLDKTIETVEEVIKYLSIGPSVSKTIIEAPGEEMRNDAPHIPE